MADLTIRTKGLRGLERALGKMDKQARKGFNADLLEAGRVVEREAHRLIREQRLVGGPRSTGRLDQMTRLVVQARGRVLIRSSATNARTGFAYPRLQEFARHRPFLYPALERGRAAVLVAVEGVLRKYERIFVGEHD